MVKSISRSEEAAIPSFSNYGEAREWFVNRYGDALVFAGADELLDGRTVFIFHLILDHDEYVDGMKILSNGESVSGDKFIFSHQKIEIFEDGHVHIVH